MRRFSSDALKFAQTFAALPSDAYSVGVVNIDLISGNE